MQNAVGLIGSLAPPPRPPRPKPAAPQQDPGLKELMSCLALHGLGQHAHKLFENGALQLWGVCNRLLSLVCVSVRLY